MDRRVPKWKVEWCKENLKYMIGKDDVEQSFSRTMTTGKAKRSKTLGKSATKALKKKKTLKMGKLSKLAKSIEAEVVEDDDSEEINME